MLPALAAMRHVVAILMLFASLGAALAIKLEHPVCPQKSDCKLNNKTTTDSDGETFYYDINGSEKIRVIYTSLEKYDLTCTTFKISINNSNLPALTKLDKVKEVNIRNCLGPGDTSYYDALKTWNVTVTEKLHLTSTHAELILQKHHLSGLQIYELKIDAYDHRPPRPSQDFLDGVKGLRTLWLNNVIPDAQFFMRLPDTLEELDLRYTKVTTAVSKMDNGSAWLERLHTLKSLRIIEASTVDVPLILPKFNVSLRNLTTITLDTVLLNSSSLNDTLNGSSIKVFELFSSRLNILPEKLFEGANLTKLVINSHNLSVPRRIFSPLQWLTELDLDDNNLDGASLLDAVSSLPQLQTLKANYNPLGSLCGDADVISAEPKWPKSLQTLDLSNTKATRICPDWIENDELTNINLRDNDIGNLTYNDLKMKRAVHEPVTLDLSNNPRLRIINVSSTDILQCRNESSSHKDSKNRTRARVKLKINPSDVKCDYGAFWLREALNSCAMWLVSDGYNTDPGEFLCPYSCDWLSECSCRHRVRDNATVVSCMGSLPQAPRWPPSGQGYPLALYVKPGTLAAMPANTTLVELHAPNNNISTLNGWDISDTLITLDLINNSIHHISEDVARSLSAKMPFHSVKLKGNWLDCTCSDEQAYKLLENSQVVYDWNETLCADNIRVSDKMRSGLCFPVFNLVLGLTCLGLLLLTLGLLLYKFQSQIRQVLFKLNCCRRYVFRVNENDTKKEKDVFLSYCHDDLEQMKIIKNDLENRGYSIIEHNRDFNPGDPILSQIMDSVQKARRTVVLLSNSFIESKWMLHEFRYAHAHALKHQTSKVIVIRYNLSKETIEVLPSDLTFYLKYRTYVDYHDEQFWENLCRGLGTPRFQVE